MAGPGYADIPCYHGDTLSFTATIPGGDYSDHDVLFQVRQGATLLADWSEFVTLGYSAGTGATTLTFTVPGEPDPDGTNKLPRPVSCSRPTLYPYDLQLTSPLGTVRTVLRGKLIVTGDISHG